MSLGFFLLIFSFLNVAFAFSFLLPLDFFVRLPGPPADRVPVSKNLAAINLQVIYFIFHGHVKGTCFAFLNRLRFSGLQEARFSLALTGGRHTFEGDLTFCESLLLHIALHVAISRSHFLGEAAIEEVVFLLVFFLALFNQSAADAVPDDNRNDEDAKGAAAGEQDLLGDR